MNKFQKFWNWFTRLHERVSVSAISSVILHLVNGSKVIAEYDEDEYEYLYEQWEGGKGVMAFRNCCVHAKDVVLMEYR